MEGSWARLDSLEAPQALRTGGYTRPALLPIDSEPYTHARGMRNCSQCLYLCATCLLSLYAFVRVGILTAYRNVGMLRVRATCA